jgi:hypothetical protein
MVTDYSGQSNKPYYGSNDANAVYSVVVGGCNNCIRGSKCYSGILGGGGNGMAVGDNSYTGIMGGCNNCLANTSPFGGLAGGYGNTNSSRYSHILGGKANCTNAYYNAIYGSLNSCTNGYYRSGVMGANACVVGGTYRMYMCSLVKVSGKFVIPHPDPAKESEYDLVHSFVESPTAGDTLYRYEILVQNCSYTLQLPDYFKFLNENPQVKVAPKDHFGRGYGIVDELLSCVTFCTTQDGKYNVLILGTRKDCDAVRTWKGVESFRENHPRILGV